MSEPIKVSDPSQKWKILMGLVIIGILIFGVSGLKSGKRLGGVEYETLSPAVATSTRYVLANSVVARIMGSQPAAQFRCFSNASGTIPVYLGFGTSTGLGVGTGFLLKASSTVWFSDQGGDLYRGDIYGVAEATTTVSLCQL